VTTRVQKRAAPYEPVTKEMSDPCCSSDCIKDPEYEFVCSIPDGLLCKVCLTVARDPQLTSCCGNNVCRTCFDKWRNATSSTSVSCPVCGTPGVATFGNKLSERDIRRLMVYCPSKSSGCNWTGEIRDVAEHRKNCGYHGATCPNKCGITVQKQFLSLHVEFECPNCEAYCQLCYIVGKKHFIEGEHMDQCPKLPLPCPNNCQDILIVREAMADHRAVCPLERVKCEYHQMGCDVAVLRRDMADHNTRMMAKHLDLSKQCILKIANKYAMVKNSLKQASTKLAEKDRLLNDTLAVMEYNQWPLKISSEASHSSYGVHTLPLVIRVTQIEKKERRAQDWYSNGFLTEVGGYKLRLVVDVSGPRGTHMAVYTQLMTGPNDDSLTWPMRGKFVVKLLNQVSDNEHYSKSWLYNNSTPRHATDQVDNGNRAKFWGARSFVSKGRLHRTSTTCQYLDNNCVYFKVFYESL